MSVPCEQKDSINEILKEQALNKASTKTIMENQHRLADQHLVLVQKIDGFFERLETILMADVERRTAVAQLEKDLNALHKENRKTHEALEKIEQRNARCDGAGIFDNFPKIWDWYQQEKGWRRMIPAACAIIAAIAAIAPYL